MWETTGDILGTLEDACTKRACRIPCFGKGTLNSYETREPFSKLELQTSLHLQAFGSLTAKRISQHCAKKREPGGCLQGCYVAFFGS